MACYKSNSNVVYSLKYHVVWCPKYRINVLIDGVDVRLKVIISEYTINQLRYDLRKLKAHGLLTRDGKRYAYRLTEKGAKVAPLFVLFHKQPCGPLASSLFHHQAAEAPRPNSSKPLEADTDSSTQIQP
jgi:hypothetical protein